MDGKPLTREYLHVLCANEACDGYPPDQYNYHKPWPAECAESHAAIDKVFDRLDQAAMTRDREWSNRLESQDTLHPDSPDLDMAIAWYVSSRRLKKPVDTPLEST